MILNTKQIQELEEAAKPLVEFLRKNFNPHVTVIVTGQQAEMVECLAAVLLEQPVSESSSGCNAP
jgi:ABC-type phosphate/phosphonate transport system substrate-binding protein